MSGGEIPASGAISALFAFVWWSFCLFDSVPLFFGIVFDGTTCLLCYSFIDILFVGFGFPWVTLYGLTSLFFLTRTTQPVYSIGCSRVLRASSLYVRFEFGC